MKGSSRHSQRDRDNTREHEESSQIERENGRQQLEDKRKNSDNEDEEDEEEDEEDEKEENERRAGQAEGSEKRQANKDEDDELNGVDVGDRRPRKGGKEMPISKKRRVKNGVTRLVKETQVYNNDGRAFATTQKSRRHLRGSSTRVTSIESDN